MLALAACGAAAPAEAQEPGPEPGVTVVVMPRGVAVEAVAEASDQLALGLYSPGIGLVSGPQTYLDISAGNRINDSLYPDPLSLLLPRSGGLRPGTWEAVEERAREAPATLVPGLLAERLEAAGIEVGAMPGVGAAALIAIDRSGTISRRTHCPLGACPGVTVGAAKPAQLGRLVDRLEGRDLLIALERARPLRRIAPIAIAGEGYSGELRSETTRIDGYVLSTDIAPTILDRYGIATPGEMTGQPIGSGGRRSVEELVQLGDRMLVVGSRRNTVIGVNLALWAGLVLVAAALGGPRRAAVALTLLAVALVWMPTTLMLGAAVEPGLLGERLIVGIGAPLMAALTLLGAQRLGSTRAGYAAFAAAAAGSVGVLAADMIAGSPLTSLSLLGPNPALGVRFFGIGNELEAVIGALLPLGVGAAVTARRPSDPHRAVSIAAAAVTLAAVMVFAPGALGADVGAAITFPAGAAAVVIAALGVGRRRAALVVAAPVAALGALVAIDLALGGDAHLSRSVLEAGGLDELGQVLERRTRLAARSFTSLAGSPYFIASVLVIAGGVLLRRRVLALFEGFPAARAGLIGGVAAAVVGTLANDSGALLLMVTTAFILAYVAIGWSAQRLAADRGRR